MRWYHLIAFKNGMEARIFRVLGVRSSDGFEGRNLFLYDFLFNCQINLSPFTKVYKYKI